MHEVCHASHAVGGLSEAAGGPRGPLLKKFHRRGHLLVPSWSGALSSMYDTILVAVGRHWFVRSTGATLLYAGLAAHASSSWFCRPRLNCIGHISCALHANRLTCISVANHIPRFGHTDHLHMHKSQTLLMVHLILPVVREDHFLKSFSGAVI